MGYDSRNACTIIEAVARRICDTVVLGLRYALDPAAKRGLSYYLNGQGFEIRCNELGAQQQVAGGGAYREGAGFGLGAERLLLAMGMQGLLTALTVATNSGN